MLAAENQIVELFESGGMSPSQVAEALCMEVAAVKLCLTNNSTIYRKQLRAEDEEITADDFRLIVGGMKEIAFDSDPQFKATRFRALEFLYNEKKGRNNVTKLGDTKINVIMINDTIQKARAAVQRALDVGVRAVSQKNDNIIDLPAEQEEQEELCHTK